MLDFKWDTKFYKQLRIYLYIGIKGLLGLLIMNLEVEFLKMSWIFIELSM